MIQDALRGELKAAKDKENERSSDVPALYKERTECRCACVLVRRGVVCADGPPWQIPSSWPSRLCALPPR